MNEKWEQTLEGIEECRQRKQMAKEKGMLCFDGTFKDGRNELVDYNCNLKYQYGQPFDTPTKLREQQIAEQRISYDKKQRNKENNLWLFWIVIFVIVVACLILSNYKGVI
jgi:hypothetical protein